MEDEIKFSQEGSTGRVLLNRPNVLNALNHQMVIDLKEKLDIWSKDEAVKFVVIEGAGDKAFCAGGDIRALYDSRPNNEEFVARFYSDEYKLNMAINSFPKPYISVMDGIVMGGGVGVTVPGTHRIVTERTICAMPETGIGLIPDVGSTYYLGRAPKSTGAYVGLTGIRMNASDAIYIGFADYMVPSDSIPSLLEELKNCNCDNNIDDKIDQTINSYKAKPEPSNFKPIDSAIAKVFSQKSMESIISELKNHGSEWSKQTLETFSKKSPTSLKLSLHAIHSAKSMSFDECIKMEYRIVLNIMKGHDIYEGIRALIVEKDNKPLWKPKFLKDVSRLNINEHFQSLGKDDLLST